MSQDYGGEYIMVEMTPRCPACDGTYEHDQNCELKTLPIRIAAKLGLEQARLEVKRRAKTEE